MPELINIDKGLDSPAFNTSIPELEEPADIRDALKLLYYGTLENGPTYEVTNSLYGNLIDFDTRIDQNNDLFTGHDGAISDIHGVGAGSEVVGTIKAQTLTNKTLTSPTITSPTVTGTATLPSTTSIGNVSSTEISYVDGVTSPIQTQIDTNTPVGMISIHAGATAPTGWLLCQGQAVSRTTYSGLFGVVSTTYGSGDGSTTFNLPNLKGRVVVGIDTGQAEFNIRGETGGSMNHQHDASNSGNTSIAHNHTVPATNGNAAGAGSHNHTVNGEHSHAGVDHYHNVNPGETNTNSAGSHSHTTGVSSLNDNASTGSGTRAISNHAHITNNTGSHSHSVNIATTASTGQRFGTEPGNSGTGTTGTYNSNFATNTTANTSAGSGGNHSHTVANNSTATADGVSGAGGSHTHTTPASTELSNLQPYMALNYIIKI
jgi:microcystin-dependent protein